MKKYFEKRCYNTETSTPIWIYEGPTATSPHCMTSTETLYLSANGDHFLHVEAGWLGRLFAERIFPLGADSALEWSQDRNIDPDVKRQHFGDLIN